MNVTTYTKLWSSYCNFGKSYKYACLSTNNVNVHENMVLGLFYDLSIAVYVTPVR
jgi:hypothetical protein